MNRASLFLLFALCACSETPSGPPTDEPDPPSQPPGPVTVPLLVASASSGLGHSCAITTTGPAYCWGFGSEGQLGNDTTITTLLPVRVNTTVVFSQVVAGHEHNCAVSTDAVLYCWGLNDRAQLGTDDLRNRKVPTIAGLSYMRFRQLAAGAYHTCGVTTDQRALCWGWNPFGQLGNGTTIDIRLPLEVAGGGSFSSVAAGGAHSCAIATGGRVFCWGTNVSGQVGDGTFERRLSPTLVAGNLLFAKISAGENHTCGLTLAGTAYCWGAGAAGQLGNGTATTANTPVAVSNGLNFSDISAGSEHTCAIGNGELYCWGNNNSARVGQPGLPTIYAQPTKVPVDSTAAGARFTAINAGRLHTCALASTQNLFCWGFGGFGQLGNGTVLTRALPTRVVVLPPS